MWQTSLSLRTWLVIFVGNVPLIIAQSAIQSTSCFINMMKLRILYLAATKTNMADYCVNNNGVIIDEMLCFVQNKIDLLPAMSIGDLCTATFTKHDIEVSKRRLFELCADDSCTRMRKRIGLKRNVQNIEDIIRLL